MAEDEACLTRFPAKSRDSATLSRDPLESQARTYPSLGAMGPGSRCARPGSVRRPARRRRSISNRDRRFNRGMREVVFEREVAVLEREDVFARRVDQHLWGRVRRARELDARLFEVVHVEVRVAKGV